MRPAHAMPTSRPPWYRGMLEIVDETAAHENSSQAPARLTSIAAEGRTGRSLQEYLRKELIDLASRPDLAELSAAVHVAAVLDSHDDDPVLIVVQSVDHSVGAASGRPVAG